MHTFLSNTAVFFVFMALSHASALTLPAPTFSKQVDDAFAATSNFKITTDLLNKAISDCPGLPALRRLEDLFPLLGTEKIPGTCDQQQLQRLATNYYAYNMFFLQLNVGGEKNNQPISYWTAASGPLQTAVNARWSGRFDLMLSEFQATFQALGQSNGFGWLCVDGQGALTVTATEGNLVPLMSNYVDTPCTPIAVVPYYGHSVQEAKQLEDMDWEFIAKSFTALTASTKRSVQAVPVKIQVKLEGHQCGGIYGDGCTTPWFQGKYDCGNGLAPWTFAKCAVGLECTVHNVNYWQCAKPVKKSQTKSTKTTRTMKL